MPTDAELLEGWRAGNAKAGEELFERHFPALYRFFRNKAANDCEELVQRTLMACLEKKDSVRDAASFRAFLFGVARFELFRFYRQRDKADRHTDIAEASVCDLDPSPSRIVANKQEHRLLAEALRRIPMDLQIVLELHYWESLTTAEIAEVVGIPSGTVKSRLRRAREAVEVALRDLPATPDALRSTMAGFETWASGLKDLVQGNE